jgi:hypothetical protein
LIDGPDGAVGEFVGIRKMADARLIASAPDLLCLLLDVLAATDANDGDALANACNDARAALAALEGNS